MNRGDKMTKGKDEIIEEEIVEDGEPTVFLRKVDVIIQNGDDEPIIIKAEE